MDGKEAKQLTQAISKMQGSIDDLTRALKNVNRPRAVITNNFNEHLKDENNRLTNMLNELGFCTTCGASMPCDEHPQHKTSL